MKELSKQEIESIEEAAEIFADSKVTTPERIWDKADQIEWEKAYSFYIAGATEQAIKAKELVEASKEILHLHLCEQEGLSSGQPTRNQWLEAVDNLSQALLNYKP